jgi:cytochrome c-type biogenesis protein CcmH/NrfG
MVLKRYEWDSSGNGLVASSKPLAQRSLRVAVPNKETQFRAALAENPGHAGAEYWLGKLRAQRRDFKSALLHYSRALAFRLITSTPRLAWAKLS